MNEKRILVLCQIALAVVLGLLLLQHWGMTFTNSDDPWIVQLGYEKGIFNGSLEVAQKQGRFWLVPIKILAQLPFIPDSWPFVNVLKMLVNGLVFVTFVLFCRKLTNAHTGILIGLVWLALIDVNSSDFSAIHGYLLMFNLQFIFLFLSFYLFLVRLDRPDDQRPIVTPYLLYAFAMLAYEPMIFYALMFPALYLLKQPSKIANFADITEQAGAFLRRNWMLVLVLVLYLALYFGFRKLFVSASARGIDSVGDPVEVIKTIFAFSINGFHVQLRPLSFAEFAVMPGLSAFMSISYAVLIMVGLFLLIPRVRDKLVPEVMYRKSSMLALAFFTISPNILFGFVEGYRQVAARDPHYVGNYMSSFPLAIAVTLVLLNLVGGEKARREKVLFLLILYMLGNAACDNYSRWAQLGDANRRGSAQWQEVVQSLSSRNFPSGQTALVCSGEVPPYITGGDQYWSKYFSRAFTSDIRFVSNKVTKEECDVVIDFRRAGEPGWISDRSRNGAAGS